MEHQETGYNPFTYLRPPLTSHRRLVAVSSCSSCSSTVRGAMALLPGSCPGSVPEVMPHGVPAHRRCRRMRRRGTADARSPCRSCGCGSLGTLNRRSLLFLVLSLLVHTWFRQPAGEMSCARMAMKRLCMLTSWWFGWGRVVTLQLWSKASLAGVLRK